jgi:hypothetical protein
MSMNIRQTVIAASVPMIQTRVVDPHQVQDRGMKVVYVNRLVDGTHAVFVGGALNVASRHSGAGQP